LTAPPKKPVIISLCNRKGPAWRAFIVAHELGPHLLGHIKSDTQIFDEKADGEGDADEFAANQFAVDLLTGGISPEHEFGHETEWPRKYLCQENQRVRTPTQHRPGRRRQ